jgi:hypothetical protein
MGRRKKEDLTLKLLNTHVLHIPGDCSRQSPMLLSVVSNRAVACSFFYALAATTSFLLFFWVGKTRLSRAGHTGRPPIHPMLSILLRGDW